MGWMSAICDAHKKVGIELLYNSLKTGSQLVLETRPVEKASTQQSRPSGPRLNSPRERERNTVMANRVRVNMLQFCLVSNSLSHTTLSNEVRGAYFSKELCRSSSLCHCVLHAYVLCVCIVGHGHGYTTQDHVRCYNSGPEWTQLQWQ